MSDTDPTSVPSPNRRDFLSGRAVRDEVAYAGGHIADALVEAGEHRPVPVSRDTIRLETSAMACPWAVVMNPGPAQQVMTASDALDIVHAMEDQLTIYRDDSELVRINQSAFPAAGHDDGLPVVEAGLFDLLLQCRDWSSATGRAFDPTTGPLIALWRTCREQGRIPTAEEIGETMNRVGIGRVAFDEEQRSIRFPCDGYVFDLGGVGKGYAIDRAAEHLQREGVSSFLIHGGHSSLFAAGDHADQGGWPVGIRNPLFTNERYATLLLQDQGMSTSGSNIQFFRHKGQRFGHILDPRTGWPAHSPEVGGRRSEAGDRTLELKDHSDLGPPTSDLRSPPAGAHNVPDSLLSVTVLAPTATEADALSTAFYVMGLEKAQDYCHNHPEVSALLIPAPARGRTLLPVVCNFPEDRLFFEASVVRCPSSVAKDDVTHSSQLTTDH